MSEGFGGTASDVVSIAVKRPNSPPRCGNAVASSTSLWPPNHKPSSAISILGVTDAEDSSVTIAITSVYQDEPVKGLGDGDAGPMDAWILENGTAKVRVERQGTGNGRVYHLAFTATDAQGASCAGRVAVCVPHDQGQGKTCVDGGPLHNSIP